MKQPGNSCTIKPRFSVFQGTIHIYALNRGYANAGIVFIIAKFENGTGERAKDIEKEKMRKRKKNEEGKEKKKERKKVRESVPHGLNRLSFPWSL